MVCYNVVMVCHYCWGFSMQKSHCSIYNCKEPLKLIAVLQWNFP
jgi:hypothetical protein